MLEFKCKVESILEKVMDYTFYTIQLEDGQLIVAGSGEDMPLGEIITIRGILTDDTTYTTYLDITEYETFEERFRSQRISSSLQNNRNSNKIRTIPTKYGGFTFRSRLEARWAVFLDALNIPYAYEHEGFNLPKSGYYLPDFFLTQQNTFLEIKPFPFSYNDIEDLMETDIFQKCEELANLTNFWVFLIAGNPFFNEYSATTITPNDNPYLRQGHLGLLPVPLENDKEESNKKEYGFFQKLFGSPPEIKYRYVLYPVEFGKVFIKTEELQNNAYHAARYAKFY